jgi:hypothetical protein
MNAARSSLGLRVFRVLRTDTLNLRTPGVFDDGVL